MVPQMSTSGVCMSFSFSITIDIVIVFSIRLCKNYWLHAAGHWTTAHTDSNHFYRNYVLHPEAG